MDERTKENVEKSPIVTFSAIKGVKKKKNRFSKPIDRWEGRV